MTVLYQKDWYNAQGKLQAVCHMTTKNTSFIEIAVLLQEMGIQNNRFMLALYDPDLRDIDPHALDDKNDPTYKYRYKVAVETRRNVWYYLREVVKVEGQGGDPVRFELNRANMAMAWCFMNGIDYIGIQPRQTGKLNRVDTPIQTPSGWRRIGDLEVGDEVVTPDGSCAPVSGVYPHGKKDLYRLYFEDGRFMDSGEEHLWKVHNRYWKPADTQWRVIPTKDIVDRMIKHPNSEARFSIPLVEPFRRPDADLPIHPYIIGVLLGDGTVSDGAITICKPDDFIRREVGALLPKGACVSQYRTDGKSFGIIQDQTCTIEERRYTLKSLISLGMNGQVAWTKEIPQCYLEGSPEQRLHLLQGLLDTDGSVDKSSSIEYSTTSEVLAKQVQELVWSLGGICKSIPRQTYFTYKGERRPGRPSWRLRVRMRDPKSCFRLPRKRDRLSDNYKSKDTLKLGIVGYQYAGAAESVCIEVAHPDHLYVLNDYIVTHNTIGALALTAWTIFLCGENITYGMYTKDDDLRTTNINRMKTFRENFPEYLVNKSRSDRDNAKGLYYAAMRNTYETIVAQADRREANKKGRGASAAGWHIDEPAFCKWVSITYPAMLSSTNRARVDAERNGKPHSNILTTTAGDPTLEEGKFVKNLVDKALPWSEKFLDLQGKEEFHETVFKNTESGLINGTFSHIQLGYDNAWLKKIIGRNSTSRAELARDFLNMWTSLAEKQVIPEAVMDRIYKSASNDQGYTQLIDGYAISWFLPERVVTSDSFKKKPMVLGMDSSDMSGGDFTSFVIVDPETLYVLGTFHCNEGNINEVGLFLSQLLLIYTKMVFVPENRSTGSSLIDTIASVLIQEGISPFVRIFNNVVNEPDNARYENVNVYDGRKSYLLYKRLFGLKTHTKSRALLYGSILHRATGIAADGIRDRTLINQLSALGVRNGRIDHSSGGHDDAVVAYLLACWFILEGRNLAVYGLDVSKLVSYMVTPEDVVEQRYLEQQTLYSDELARIDMALRKTTDPIVRDTLLRERRSIMRRMDPTLNKAPEAAEQLRLNPTKYLESKYTEDTPIYTAEDLFNIVDTIV